MLAADLTNRNDLARVEAVLRTDASITLLLNNAGVRPARCFNPRSQRWMR
jgi:short-subunit dehydrogenase